jgi:rubrerythrin
MRKMTEDNLKSAFAGESQAHMKYLIFAEIAEREGKLNLARLFRAISDAEKVHATNHFRALGMIKSSSDNTQVCIDGENYEIEEMYPAFNAVAQLQDEKEAIKSIHYALEAEKIHSVMYQKAKKAVDEGKDVDVGNIYICQVCGHTVEGEAPDKCPICGAPKEKFRKF